MPAIRSHAVEGEEVIEISSDEEDEASNSMLCVESRN